MKPIDLSNSNLHPFVSETFISPTHGGVLNGLTFAAKDVIDIKGQKTGCGNPTWLNSHQTATNNAEIIDILLSNGSTFSGKTVLGEFCSGSTGVNHFYGMPLNSAAPERVPGGSSSGSAAVVSAGIVDFALGTDAAGSVRVPASFCGVLGMRPSYSSISLVGIKSFAPSFDTVGILSKDIDILGHVFQILTKNQMIVHKEKPNNFYIIQDFLSMINITNRKIIEKFIRKISNILELDPTYINLSDLHPDICHPEFGISEVFKLLFCTEIWELLESWIKDVKLEFSKTTYVNFNKISALSKNDRIDLVSYRNIYKKILNNFLNSDSLLCIPTTPFIAPLRDKQYNEVNEFDYEKLRPLISLSSIGELPQINIPLKIMGRPPIGVSLLSRSNHDFFLINMVKAIIAKQI
jgi:amidase